MRTENDPCPLPIRSRRKKKQPKTECCIGGEDLISKLPDDILVRVLCLLAPKEVITCGALSRRWTPLPKLVPMALKFVRKYETPSLIEEIMFIHHVNEVLDSYPGESLTELSISYLLSASDQPLDIRSQFDKWVQFAMAKKARKFNLDLSGIAEGCYYPEYRFPPILYDKKRLRSRDIGLPKCTSLTDLRLACVNVTGEQIKHFLECCPFLESLYVSRSYTLTSLKVDCPIRLKFLEIRYCNKLQVFEISAPNLISFKYLQYPMKRMPLKSAPQLNEMLVSGYDFLVHNFHLFTSYFAQIETLSLVVEGSSSQEFRQRIGIPTLRNLKNLTICAAMEESGLCFSSWIEASPLLRRFVFEEKLRFNKGGKPVKPRMCPHQLLKEVEVVGFVGDVLDTELVMYITENAVNLDKIVLDCRERHSIGTPYEDAESKRRSLARVRARKLKSMIRSTVMCVLIP